MSDKTYSGQLSYHNMLTRAQDYDPVVLYWILKYLLDEPEREDVNGFFESKRIRKDSQHGYMLQGTWSNRPTLIEEVFRNSTIHLGVWGELTNDLFSSASIYARIEFVRWLKTIDLVFDDEAHFVTIPA